MDYSVHVPLVLGVGGGGVWVSYLKRNKQIEKEKTKKIQNLFMHKRKIVIIIKIQIY